MVAVLDPILAADMNAALYMPVCRLVQQATQNLTTATPAALTFAAGSEEIDTDGFHDTVTNNSRITPNLPGYYHFEGTFAIAASTAVTIQAAYFAKNATTIQPYVRIKPGAANTVSVVTVSAKIDMNGTTDYMELMASQTSGGTLATQASGGINSTFTCSRLRLL